MIAWRRALKEAGVATAQLQTDFTEAARIVRRFDPAVYAAQRLLAPADHQPGAIAATAFMTYTDNTIDRGQLDDREHRAARFASWEQVSRRALDGQQTDHPLLRALVHTVRRHEQLRAHAHAFLDAAPVDLDFAGFATDDDYQRYVDGYSVHAFMLVNCLNRPDPDEAYREAGRRFIEPAQRMEFLLDLADDLRDGRLALLQSDLERCGVTREDLESGRQTAGVRMLVAETCARVRRALPGARSLPAATPPDCRRMVEAILGLVEHMLGAVERHGAALTRTPPRREILAALRILARAHRDRPLGGDSG